MFAAVTGGGEGPRSRSSFAVFLVFAFGLAPLPLTGCGNNEFDATDAPYERGVEVGREYTYELTTHCGIAWARIDGSWWQTEPLDDGNANPPPGWDNPVERGTLRIESDDTATFDGGPGGAIRFERTDIIDLDDPSLPDSVLFCD